MRKFYLIVVVIIIISSAFLYGCGEEETLDYCCKCGEIATEWIRVPYFDLEVLDLNVAEAADSIAGCYHFYLCDDCMEERGITIIDADGGPWDDKQ